MRRLVLIPLIAAISFSVVGCKKGNFSERANATRGNVLRYPIVTKPTTLDPGRVEDGDTIDVIQQVFEGLVGWGEDNKPAPRLAKSWDIQDGGKTYVFHLREDAKFSNGRPVTAADFKWCIERNCDPKFASPTAATYLPNIIGVDDMIKGKATSVSGLVVVDEHTLKIQIDKPRPYFLGKLTYPAAFVFAKEGLADPKKEMSKPSEMIGTGGFKFDTINIDQVVKLTANDKYYEGRPKIDGIERPYVGDASTRLSMFKAGDVDLLALERQDAVSLQTDPAFKDMLKFFDRPSTWYVGINCDVIPALKDRRVRQALAMSVDRDKILNVTLNGMNKRADSIVPPGVFGHRDKVNGLPYDVAKAKKLLAEAGFPDGNGFPDLEMSLRNNRPDIAIVAQELGNQWAKALNIKVHFRALEWGTYLKYHDDRTLPFFHMRWAADYLDAENFLSTLLATYGNENKIKYSNPAFDALCQKADTTLDEAERLKLYGQAEDMVLQDAPFIPIYFQRDAELIRPRIQGIRESLFGHLPHTKVSLK